MIPRDYQRAAVAAARSRIASHGNTLVALPVGAGKTAVAGFYIGEESEQDPTASFLVLQHTDELIEQNRRTIGAVTGLPASIVKAERDDWSGRIVFGSVQTLARAARRVRMPRLSHLVIDECHRAAADSYQSIIADARAANPAVKLLGLSATPERGDGRSLRKTFSNIAFHLPISTLIAQGILVPPRTFTIDLGISDDLDQVGATAGDYDMDAAAKVLNRAVLNEAVVAHWQERAADRRTIAFCATVAHAEAVAAAFRAAGITARFMRQDFFEFTPQFKLLVAGNHKPSIRNVDEAMRRRLHMVPFTVTIPPARRDKRLPERLLAERDGILAWALQGCLEWQRLGLRPPATVLAATDEYFEAEDAIGRWLDECCETGARHIEITGQLFASWKSWAEAGGEYVGSSKRFSDALINRGFQPQRDGGARRFRGLRLREPLPTTGPMQF